MINTFRNARLGEKRIQSLQEKKLRRLINHVYQFVPFYQRLFDESGIGPGDIESLEDLEKLPLTNKAMYRMQRPEDYTADGSDLLRCLKQTTSGSSGEPFSIYWDDVSAITFLSISIRAHRWLGGQITDRILAIGPTYYPDKLLVQRLGLGRVTLLSPTNEPEMLLDSYERLRPDVLLTYPSVLKSLLTKRPSLRHRVRMVVTSGEYLEASTLASCEETFGGPTFQFYGSWEFGRIANECRFRTGLHLNEDIAIAEFLQSEMNPTQSQIVLTNLYNYTMPFLRYVQGDEVQVVPGRCPCGSPFTRIRIVEGRQSDVIELPGGSKVSALRCLGGLSLVPSLRQFRFIQESLERATLEVVLDSASEDSDLQGAVAQIETYLEGILITLRRVDRILPGPSGKTTKFVSRLNQD